MDAIKNFAISKLATGINATQITATVLNGEGSRFPDTTIDGPFNVVIWNSSYANPALAYHAGEAAIYRVIERTNDQFTFKSTNNNRDGEEGTLPIAHNTIGKNYSVGLMFTSKTMQDLVTAINSKQSVVGTIRLVNPSFTSASDAANNRYPTVTAAMNAAVAGDEVEVTPGYYDEIDSISLKNGVNLYLHAGAGITSTTSNDGVVFKTVGTVNCIIAGYGDIGKDGTYFNITGSGEIYISANTIFSLYINGNAMVRVNTNKIVEELIINNPNANFQIHAQRINYYTDNSSSNNVVIYDASFGGTGIQNSAKPKLYNCNFDNAEFNVYGNAAPELYNCYLYYVGVFNNAKPKFYNCSYFFNVDIMLNHATVQPTFIGYNRVYVLESVTPTAIVYASGSLIVDNPFNINIVPI